MQHRASQAQANVQPATGLSASRSTAHRSPRPAVPRPITIVGRGPGTPPRAGCRDVGPVTTASDPSWRSNQPRRSLLSASRTDPALCVHRQLLIESRPPWQAGNRREISGYWRECSSPQVTGQAFEHSAWCRWLDFRCETRSTRRTPVGLRALRRSGKENRRLEPLDRRTYPELPRSNPWVVDGSVAEARESHSPVLGLAQRISASTTRTIRRPGASAPGRLPGGHAGGLDRACRCIPACNGVVGSCWHRRNLSCG